MQSKNNNIKQSIVFADTESSSIFRAFRKTLTTLNPEWHIVSTDEYVNKEGDHSQQLNNLRIGVIYAQSPIDGSIKMLKLLSVRCSWILVVGSEGTTSDPKKWRREKKSFWPEDDAILFSELRLPDLLKRLSEQQDRMNSMEAMGHERQRDRLCQKFEAIVLQMLLEQFSHHAKNDIVNRFLAPARMLCKAGIHEANEAWFEEARPVCEIFKTSVIDNIEQQKTVCGPADKREVIYGKYGFEIIDRFKRINLWLNGDMVPSEAFGDGQCFEPLMDLMTEIRTLAGVKTDGSSDNNKPYNGEKIEIVTGSKMNLEKRNILVIDDHAESWLPCLKQVKKRMAVEIDIAERPVSKMGDSPVYSLDEYEMYKKKKRKGENLELRARSLSRSISEYDLVLLDIFYSTDESTGLEFLREMRRRRIYVPVILWTTSRDKDLPAKAVLANGYLYKKETDIDAIVCSLLEWMEHGRGNRETPLMHPFFSHVIVSPKFRKLAEDLTHWCLKLADSFHAIDSTLFRFFNDHGGRHIWGVMIRLEQLLSPYLLARNEQVLPCDRISFQKEIFAFYIAAICHDLGMFPFKFEQKAMLDSPESIKDMMSSIRKLHGLRGLTLVLPDSLPHVVEDPEFSELVGILKKIKEAPELGPDVLKHAAILILYHSSLLDLKEPKESDDFGKLTSKAKDKIEEYDNLKSKLISLENVCKSKAIDYDHLLKGCFESFTWEKRERLRRQCAIFMLADELDIEWTRLPANFLMSATNRNDRDDTENFKRQVVEKISVQQNQIKIEVRCESPSQVNVDDFVKYFTPDYIKKASRDHFRKWVNDKLSFLNEHSDCTSLVVPFRFSEHEADDNKAFEYELNAFEKCLENFFSKSVSERTNERRSTAAWFAALWVVCELCGKFQIAKSVGLEELDIRLVWKTGAMATLTILDQPPVKDNLLKKNE